MTREQWILHMYDLGNKGVRDFGSTAKRVIPATKDLIHKTTDGPRLNKLSSKLDVQGFDMPRDDIQKVKLKNKVIRIGGDTINKNAKVFKKHILPILNNAFNTKEMKNVDLYIEYPSKNLPHNFEGMHNGYVSNKKHKFSTVQLKYMKDPDSALHEIVHAVKYENGKYIHERNKDEAETVLETLVRMSPKDRKKAPCESSYYGMSKGQGNCRDRQKKDIEIIESSCNIKNKSGLTKCITKNLHKTSIGQIKIPKKHRPK